MTVIVCNNPPDAVRGMLKRWFIEPKPNVFVGSINKKVRDKTLEYIRRNAKNIGILILSSDNTSQGFFVKHFGETDRRPENLSGHCLIAEKWEENIELIDELSVCALHGKCDI